MNYPLKNYYNPETPPQSPAPESGDFDPYAAYGLDATEDSELYGDEEMGDGVSGYEEMDGEVDLKSYLKDLKESVSADSNLDAQAKGKLLAEISQALLKVNQGQVGSSRRRETLLAEVETEIASIEGELAIQPALKEAHAQIETLKKTIEANTFSSDHEGKKRELLEKLGKAQSDLDLNGNNETLTVVQETLTEVQDGLEEILGVMDEEKQTNLDAFNSKVDDLKSKIESSKGLSDDQKKDYQSKLETQSKDLRTQLENGTLKLEDAEDGLDQLNLEAGDIENKKSLIEEYDGLGSKIPTGTHSSMMSKWFARGVNYALNENDWTGINSFLDQMIIQTKVDDNNDIIMNFTGALYYKVAGKDKEKLMQLLELIPKETREKMIQGVLAYKPEIDDGQGYNTDSEKETYGVYGTPNDVAELLSSSLLRTKDPDKNKHRLGDSGNFQPATPAN